MAPSGAAGGLSRASGEKLRDSWLEAAQRRPRIPIFNSGHFGLDDQTAMRDSRMRTHRRSAERRPVLRLSLTVRASRTERLWRRVLLYYLRHAERVSRSEALRMAVRVELDRSVADITDCLFSLAAEALRDYERLMPLQALEIDARYREVVRYVKLFEMADRVFAVDPSTEGYARLRVRVSQALRNPAQVVADTYTHDSAAAIGADRSRYEPLQASATAERSAGE